MEGENTKMHALADGRLIAILIDRRRSARLSRGRAIWNDRPCCMLAHFLAQLGAIIRFVAEATFGSLYSADQALEQKATV